MSRFGLSARSAGGGLVVLGAVAFLVAAFLPLSDAYGNSIYALPLEGQVRLISSNQALWFWANVLFTAGVILTLFGLVALRSLFKQSGPSSIFGIGLAAYQVGTVLWAVYAAFRSSVGIWAAQEMLRTGSLPAFYPGLYAGAESLFAIYTVLVIVSLAAFGVALQLSSAVPRRVGYFIIGYSALELILFLATRDLAPFLHYLAFALAGTLLLAREYRAHEEEQSEPGAASPGIIEST